MGGEAALTEELALAVDFSIIADTKYRTGTVDQQDLLRAQLDAALRPLLDKGNRERRNCAYHDYPAEKRQRGVKHKHSHASCGERILAALIQTK